MFNLVISIVGFLFMAMGIMSQDVMMFLVGSYVAINSRLADIEAKMPKIELSVTKEKES